MLTNQNELTSELSIAVEHRLRVLIVPIFRFVPMARCKTFVSEADQIRKRIKNESDLTAWDALIALAKLYLERND